MISWKWKALKSAVKAWVFKLRYGFDYRDCWNLDHALAKWLAPRLLYLAQHHMGYPGVGVYESPDHGALGWSYDLMKAGSALQAEVDKWDMEYNHEEELRIHKEAQEAMDWVAKWWGHLWD